MVVHPLVDELVRFGVDPADLAGAELVVWQAGRRRVRHCARTCRYLRRLEPVRFEVPVDDVGGRLCQECVWQLSAPSVPALEVAAWLVQVSRRVAEHAGTVGVLRWGVLTVSLPARWLVPVRDRVLEMVTGDGVCVSTPVMVDAFVHDWSQTGVPAVPERWVRAVAAHVITGGCPEEVAALVTDDEVLGLPAVYFDPPPDGSLVAAMRDRLVQVAVSCRTWMLGLSDRFEVMVGPVPRRPWVPGVAECLGVAPAVVPVGDQAVVACPLVLAGVLSSAGFVPLGRWEDDPVEVLHLVGVLFDGTGDGVLGTARALFEDQPDRV